MKALFIWPNKASFGFSSIGLALLSALLKRAGHEVELFNTTFINLGYRDNTAILSEIKSFKSVDFSGYDVTKKKLNMEEELLKRLERFQPDFVGVSALSDEVAVGLLASKVVKQWNDKIPVLWGNKAATMIPERILADRNVDYVCIGEGIELIVDFAECLANNGDPRTLENISYRDENGKLRQNRLRPFFQGLDSLPFLDWSIFERRQFLKPYDGKVHIGGDHMISWGCPRVCTYCINYAYRKLYTAEAGNFLRRYSVDRIIKELKSLARQLSVALFKFHDEDFTLKPIEYFRELAQKYKARIGIPFVTMANARTLTKEKVKLLKKMNCLSVSIGIETGNDYLRKEVLKRQESKEDIISATHMLNDAGIRTSSFNMLGIPFETRSSIMETIELNRKSEVRYPNTVFFYPLEKTELREIALRQGFLKTRGESVFDDINPSLNLPGISSEELIAVRERFVLYVKMPQEYYKYIQRSERRDAVGKRLSAKLYEIYDDSVLNNDGLWDDKGRGGEYLSCLEQIYTCAK